MHRVNTRKQQNIRMKPMNYLFILLISLLSCKMENPVKFSKEALQDTFLTLNDESLTFKEILKTHKGKTIVIDVWASWCGDCLRGMPKVKTLQETYPDATFIFLSLDRSEESWKRGIEKYNVEGEHYYMQSGRKGDFGSFLDLDWIPRYLVVDKNGKIALFKAVLADDERIIEKLTIN